MAISSSVVETAGGATRSTRRCASAAPASAPRCRIRGVSRSSTRPSMTVVSANFTSTHRQRSRPHGVSSALAVPISQTATLSGANSQVTSSAAAG
ncbi:hypothetical protein C8054_06570 [Micromonospora sp. RP3T]|nr:hypothetical protein C8054_06570 [Micromonospora sp. RP3T]